MSVVLAQPRMVAISPWLFVALLTPPSLAGMGALAARFVERAREKARHAALIAGLGAPSGKDALASLTPGTVATLEGIVSGASPEVVTFHPYGTSFLDEPNVYAATHNPTERARARTIARRDRRER